MTKKLTRESFDKEVLEVLEAQEAVVNPPALLQQLMQTTRPSLGGKVGQPPTRGLPPLRGVAGTEEQG